MQKRIKPIISIVVPIYNASRTLRQAADSLLPQINDNIELIFYDDCSTDRSVEIAREYNQIKVFCNKKNVGPAATRNNAIKICNGEIIAFMDSDCVADKYWVKNIINVFKDPEVNVIMGQVKIPKSNFLGDSISALGFPGGGSVGFEKMWKVDEDGYTKHITSCNFAARKKVFEKYGLFDESFPLPGGEDPELAFRWSKAGVKIKFVPEVLVWHEPRKDLRSFVKWMFKRGRSNYYFKKKVGKVGSYINLRIWSTKNIIKKFFFDSKIFLIILLIFLSILLQQLGYIAESFKKGKL